MTQPQQSGKGVIKVKLLRAGRVLRSYKVQSDTFTIGTAPGSTIRAAGDPDVQPTHATLYIDEGEITLVPEPDAVVLLNGEPVDFAVPSPTDMIKIGKLTLQVELVGSLESITPGRSSTQPPVQPSKPAVQQPSRPAVSKSTQSPIHRQSPPPGARSTRPELLKPRQKTTTPREESPAPKASSPAPTARAASPRRAPKATLQIESFTRNAPTQKTETLPPKAAAPIPVPSRPPQASLSSPAASPLPSPGASTQPASPIDESPIRPDESPIRPVVEPALSDDIPLFEEDEISVNFDLEAKTAQFQKPSTVGAPKQPVHDTVPGMSPIPEPDVVPETIPERLRREKSAPPAETSSLSGFPDMDADYFFEEEDEEDFVEPFSLADALLSEKKAVKTDGPKEPYSVAHVIRVVNDMVVDAFGVVPDTPYKTIDGEVKCYIIDDKKAGSSQLILETGPTVSGEIVIRNEKKILDGSPSFRIELKDGDSALLNGSGGTYKIEVYRPPLAPKKGQLFSISYPMLAIVIVLALALHGAAAYALRYIDLDRVGDISEEEEEVFAEVIMEQPDKPKPKEEQVVQEEVAQDAKAIAERAPKVSQRTIKKRIKQTSQKQQVSSLLSVLSRGSGKAGKSNKLKDLISNIDAVKSTGGGSGFSIAGAIASLPGKGVNIARSGGGGAISTLSGDQVAGKGTGLASLGKGKRQGKVRGKVTKMSSGAKIGGSLSREDVLRVINKNIHAIQACYERALMGNPALSGRVAMDWTVSTTGRVKSVRVRSSTIGSPKVASCISGVIKRWKFPRPKGGDANITFPFLFRSGS